MPRCQTFDNVVRHGDAGAAAVDRVRADEKDVAAGEEEDAVLPEPRDPPLPQQRDPLRRDNTSRMADTKEEIVAALAAAAS